MVKLLKTGNSFNSPRKYYVSDTLVELDSIANFGDLALVPENADAPSEGTAKIYIRGSGYWVEYNEGGGGSSGGVTREEVQIMIQQYLDDEEKMEAVDNRIVQKAYNTIAPNALGSQTTRVETNPVTKNGVLIFGTIQE